jgi:hypothetical protein
LYTSSDSNGTYTVRDSSLVSAGQTANLKYKGSSKTTYYVRTAVKGVSANATNVADTTVFVALTTQGTGPVVGNRKIRSNLNTGISLW